VGLVGLERDCVKGRRSGECDGDGGNDGGEVDEMAHLRKGHSGLSVSKMGLEMCCLSMDETREEGGGGCFLPFRDSVSLVHEKERRRLVVGVASVAAAGGVKRPMGTKSSASLSERFSLTMASLSSIVAQRGGCGSATAWRGRRGEAHTHGDTAMSRSQQVDVKATHCGRGGCGAVGIHSAGPSSGRDRRRVHRQRVWTR